MKAMLCLAAALIAGCGVLPAASLITFTYPAADRLSYNLAHKMAQEMRPLQTQKPILATSFVKLESLEKSSKFGRLISEQMASRLSQVGFTVLEIKPRNSLYIKGKRGEFALSQEIKKISRMRKAQAILVGTYSVINPFVYVTARIVHADGHVYASHDFDIPLNVIQPPENKQIFSRWPAVHQ